MTGTPNLRVRVRVRGYMTVKKTGLLWICEKSKWKTSDHNGPVFWSSFFALQRLLPCHGIHDGTAGPLIKYPRRTLPGIHFLEAFGAQPTAQRGSLATGVTNHFRPVVIRNAALLIHGTNARPRKTPTLRGSRPLCCSCMVGNLIRVDVSVRLKKRLFRTVP